MEWQWEFWDSRSIFLLSRKWYSINSRIWSFQFQNFINPSLLYCCIYPRDRKWNKLMNTQTNMAILYFNRLEVFHNIEFCLWHRHEWERMKGKSTCKAYFTRGFFCIRKKILWIKMKIIEILECTFQLQFSNFRNLQKRKEKSCFMPIIKIRNVFMFVCIPTYLFQSCYNCRL